MWDKETIIRKLEVPQHGDEAKVWQTSRWVGPAFLSVSQEYAKITYPQLNRDNVPLPPSRRTWGAWSYVGFWVTTGVNISGWTAGSALLSLGMTVGKYDLESRRILLTIGFPGQAMAVVVIGQCLVAACVVLTGLVGAQWHVGFPMWNRVSTDRILTGYTYNSRADDVGSQSIVLPGSYSTRKALIVD